MTGRKRTNPGSYAELRMWSQAFADAQANRIAFENRERSGTVEMEAFGAVVDLFREAEERLRKEMVNCYKVTVPAAVRKWQEETAGIGESTLARLLGIIGDPRMAYPKHWEGTGSERHLVEDEPHERTIGQLWQYCGHGAPKNRNVKGDAAALMKNGLPDAKKLVYLMAAAQVKTNAKGGSGYRWVYDAAKAKYSEKVHSAPCSGGFSGALYVKCKTHVDTPEEIAAKAAEFSKETDLSRVAGSKPAKAPKEAKLGYAQAGDPFQPSHIHANALRLTGKEILRDLWLAAGDELEPLTPLTGTPDRPSRYPKWTEPDRPHQAAPEEKAMRLTRAEAAQVEAALNEPAKRFTLTEEQAAKLGPDAAQIEAALNDPATMAEARSLMDRMIAEGIWNASREE